MAETIHLGEIAIAVTRKNIKHVHLSVYPPGGRVTLVAPTGTRLEVARAYAVSRLGWIRDQQAKLRGSGEGNTAPVHRARESFPLGKALSALRQGAGGEAFRTAHSPQDHAHRAARHQQGQAPSDHARVAQVTTARRRTRR